MNHQAPEDIFKADFEVSRGQPAPVLLPRVSVIVPCFNYGQFVAEALASVAAQTYAEFRCVVVDDASTDNSAEIVEQWIAAKRDPRFVLVTNAVNLGQMGSFAAGLAQSEGEFVAFLDADDIWFPEFLARHIAVHLNRAQAAGASCSDLVQIDTKSRALVGSIMPPVFINEVPRRKIAALSTCDIPTIDPANADLIPPEPIEAKYIAADWGTWHWSTTSGMVFRRPLIDLLMPADPATVRLGADIYLMVAAHYFAGSFVIGNALGGYRRHGKNCFSSLPVSGAAGSAPISVAIGNAQNAYRAVLNHLLEANDQLAAAFSPVVVRKFTRTLFRYLLLRGVPVSDPRLYSIIGRSRVARDRIRARIGFLRRGLK